MLFLVANCVESYRLRSYSDKACSAAGSDIGNHGKNEVPLSRMKSICFFSVAQLTFATV